MIVFGTELRLNTSSIDTRICRALAGLALKFGIPHVHSSWAFCTLEIKQVDVQTNVEPPHSTVYLSIDDQGRYFRELVKSIPRFFQFVQNWSTTPGFSLLTYRHKA
jgi:hypothetical protein